MATRNKQDPTGQNRNRKKGARALQSRITRAERQIKALFRAIPKERRRQAGIINNAEVTFYDYDYPPIEQERLTSQVQGILDEELETIDPQMPPDWFWQDNLEQPYRQGTVQTVNSLNQQIAAAAIAGIVVRGLAPQPVPIDNVLQSQAYLDRLNNVYVSNYPTIKGLSQNTTKQVMQQINAGIKAKQPPSVIAETISERFDVSRSSAKRIADTEINQAFTNAEMDATVIAADVTGLRAGVIHISALLPTTRNHHANRHGNAYTVEQQRQWWDTGTNRINCKCSTISVLIDAKGKVVDTNKQKTIKAEKVFFD